jgi:acyl-CoA synthetase (AMP-forming)/AMP-acid ligase II
MHTVGVNIANNALRLPHKPAIITAVRSLTWSEFARRVRQLGSALYECGLRRTDRVAILSMNRCEYYELYGACSATGFVITPINFRLASPEILQLLEDSAPRILIFEARYANIVNGLRSRLAWLQTFVCLDGPVPEWALDYEEFLARQGDSRAPIEGRLEDPAYLLYTSGTTGQPKGVVHTNGSVAKATLMTALASQFTRDSVLLQTSPSFHAGGIIYVNCATLVGGTTVLHTEFNPARVIDSIESNRVTHTFMVPAMLQAVMAVPELRQRDVSSLRIVHSAAAPIPVPLLRDAIAIFGSVFSIQYGSTEAFTVCALPRDGVKGDGTRTELHRLASVGHPLPGVCLRIVDDEMRDCPQGATGELLVRTPSLMSRYWNNDIETMTAIQDGWFRTGDMGYLDPEGHVLLVDRKKDMIISGGENIYSREVENALLQHPDVADAAVIGVPDEKWGEAVKAAVILKAGRNTDGATLIEHCGTLIARYKCPKSVAFVQQLPLLASGKVDKVTLRRMAREHPGARD